MVKPKVYKVAEVLIHAITDLSEEYNVRMTARDDNLLISSDCCNLLFKVSLCFINYISDFFIGDR